MARRFRKLNFTCDDCGEPFSVYYLQRGNEPPPRRRPLLARLCDRCYLICVLSMDKIVAGAAPDRKRPQRGTQNE